MLPIILTINDENDRDFVSDIYSIYGKKLFFIANSYLHNTYDSDECVTDTFAVLIEKLQHFQTLTEQHQKNFLVKVCRCIAINKFNKNIRHSFREKPWDEILPKDEESLCHENEDVPNIVISEESKKRLEKLIEDMAPKYGDILYLKAFLGIKNPEIAKITGLPTTAVAVRLHRARRILLEKMEETGYSPYNNN